MRMGAKIMCAETTKHQLLLQQSWLLCVVDCSTASCALVCTGNLFFYVAVHEIPFTPMLHSTHLTYLILLY